MYRPRNRNPNNVILTLNGLLEYDNTLFDTFVLPDGMDRQTMINAIMVECGQNELRYPQPEYCKAMINHFFKVNEWRFNELWKTTQYDYDPLINYDLEITVERKNKGNRKLDADITSSGTSESQVSAFNSLSYSPERKAIDSSSNGTTENEDTSGEDSETRHEVGDNSARSTQYMIKEQRDVVDYNLYMIIASEFEDFITIPVYSRSYTNLDFGGC